MPKQPKTRRSLPRAKMRNAPPGAASSDPLPERYYVQIPCTDEAEQRRFYEQFRREGRRVRLVTV
jgi:hypothetical protein